MEWQLEKVTDYFDNRNQINIWEYSQEYGKLPYEERILVDRSIKVRIERHLDQLLSYSSDSIIQVGAMIVDDIYRAGNLMYAYNSDVEDYLQATAKCVMNWYTKHGIMIHYMTNNTFSDYLRPLILFPIMLSKTNIIYICPQHIAWKKMKENDIPIEQFKIYYEDYRDEAYDRSQDIISRCCEHKAHYIHLDIDAGEEAFEKSLSYNNTKGHIVAFREEAPQDSAKIILLS